jgi:hypothetical protein
MEAKICQSCAYELRDAATFEKFLNTPDKVNPENLITEVYISITKRI